jgi:hypothetical protein
MTEKPTDLAALPEKWRDSANGAFNTPVVKIPRVYICQFCEKESLVKAWTDNGDNCPKCGKAYDPMLAQEMDD